MAPWVRPIYDVLYQFVTPNEVKQYMDDKLVEIAPLGFMRGRTFKNTWIVADEMQNSTISQMKMLLTRLGENSRLVVTGDLQQCDLNTSDNGLKDLLKRLGNALMKEKDHKDTQKLMNSKNLVIYKVPVKPPSGAAKRKKRKQKELDQQGANELQANIIVDPYANEKISIKDFINQANTIIKSEVLISQENIEKVKPIFDQLEIYFKSLLHLASEKQDINDILIEIEKMQNLICDKIGIGTSWVLAWVEKRGTTSEVPKITRMLDQKVPRRLLVDRSGPRNNRENASTVKGGIDEFGSSIRKRMKTLSK
jgi:hypothetical protein